VLVDVKMKVLTWRLKVDLEIIRKSVPNGWGTIGKRPSTVRGHSDTFEVQVNKIIPRPVAGGQEYRCHCCPGSLSRHLNSDVFRWLLRISSWKDLNNCFAPGSGASIVICVYVCLTVCLSARTSQKPHVQISPNLFYVLPLPWLGPLLTAARFVMYFRFSTWRCFHIMERRGKDQRRRKCLVPSARWRYRGDVGRLRPHLVISWKVRKLILFTSHVQ